MRAITKSVLTIVALTIALPYAGCDKSKLDLQPNSPTEASFFIQESDFNQAVYSVYAKQSDFWNYAGNANRAKIFLLMGDDITTNATTEQYEIFGPFQSADGSIGKFYRTSYQLIGRANVVLEKIAAESGVYTTPNLKNYHKGEALFLRGLANFYLWNYFGTAPLMLERVTSQGQLAPSNSKENELLDQAIADFTEAATLLPDVATWGPSNRGRATNNAANGMLGKSLVFRGSVTGAAADYQAAIAAFNKITGVSLVADFGANFAWDTENNQESLYEYQASQAFAFNNVWLDNDFDNAIGELTAYWGSYDNHWSLFGQSRFFATEKLLNAFDPADPRRDLTLDPGNRFVRKYVLKNKLDQPGVGSVNNPRILRYADVLLLKAEAILGSGGSKSEAIQLINQVRTRARNISGGTAPADLSTAESDANKIFDWINRERLTELAGEGGRWQDLRRWHIGKKITLNNAYFSSNLPTMSFDPTKHLVLPIPLAELDVNPNVTQNPGY